MTTDIFMTKNCCEQECLLVEGVPSVSHIHHKNIYKGQKIDLDLQMTLTFKHVLAEYKHKQLKDRGNMMFYSFDIDPMTLVLKFDIDMVKT